MAPKPATFRLGERRSGVLLHISSLPNRYGIGDLGPSARRFADWLKAARQGWWQMFPISPIGYGNSPYQSLSVFAGEPLFISLDDLARDGLLSRASLRVPDSFSRGPVRYEAVRRYKLPLLRRAFERFEHEGDGQSRAEFKRFVRQNAGWVDDFALFSALSAAHQRAPWWTWSPGLRDRRASALDVARARYAAEIRFHQFLQFQFFKQWAAFREYCATRSIGIIGDAPIFVAHDSSDVWVNRHLFFLDKDGQPTIAAGVPPDYFSKTGQLWGNPLYRWSAMKKNRFAWWIERFRQAFRLFDAVRLDHFIGFHNYWAVPAGAKTAESGEWRPAPGRELFERILKVIPSAQFIAEDLGVVTNPVKALRDRFNFPGMIVLQFAFGSDNEANNFIPHNHRKNAVVYTGTHDNDTAAGWFWDRGRGRSSRTGAQAAKERRIAMAYLPSDGKEPHWDMIRVALSSRADTTIIPMQDVLGLGSSARMNRPGTSQGNWEWRLGHGAPSHPAAARLQKLVATYGRGTNPSVRSIKS